MVKLNMYKYGDFRKMLRDDPRLRGILKPSEREAFLKDLQDFAGYQFDTATVKKFIYRLMADKTDKKKYSGQDLEAIMRALDQIK